MNNARIRNPLYLYYKNVYRLENLIDIFFRDKLKYDGENPILGKFLQKVDKRKIKENLRDAPNPDPRFSNADIQQRLDNLRGGPKPHSPLPPSNDFDLPSPPSGNIDKYDNRPLPLPPPLKPLPFQPQQLTYFLLGKYNKWLLKQQQESKHLRKKVSDNIAKTFPRAEDILNQKQEKVSPTGKVTFLEKFE